MGFAKLHRIVGLSTFLVFLGTGVYMNTNFPALYETNEAIRYLFRANHVYLLFSGLLNIALGFAIAPEAHGWRSTVCRIGSWLIVSTPALLLWAFIAEPATASPMRPFTLLGVVVSLTGIVLQLIGRLEKRP